ncbi:DUF2283 domain-containing protein [Actinoplanes sp. NPDC051851]|uniref:DUF2283 domain-containing protein n=1 Tax=Actinoplanes sp. NPDC051851 TaxID=3154753 RepID=UPI00343D07F6
MQPTVTYDEEADAAYLNLAPGSSEIRKRQFEVSVPDGAEYEVYLDLDASHRIIGVEVIGASAALTAETLIGLPRI